MQSPETLTGFATKQEKSACYVNARLKLVKNKLIVSLSLSLSKLLSLPSKRERDNNSIKKYNNRCTLSITTLVYPQRYYGAFIQ